MTKAHQWRTFREMPPKRVAIIGISLVVVLVCAGLFYDRIPGVIGGDKYRAYFAEVGSLRSGDVVQLSGVDVGTVGDIRLENDRVLVEFTVESPVQLGTATGLSIVTVSALGTRGLRVNPGGVGELSRSEPIPVERTVAPYSLSNALDDLGGTLTETDTAALDTSLRTVSQILDTTSPELGGAVSGVERLSQTIGSRDEQLAELFAKTQSVTSILSNRSQQLNTLVLDANTLLGELSARQETLERLIIGVRFLTQQVSGLLRENRSEITPALERLDSVLKVLQDNKDSISAAIPGLRNFSLSLGESIASGPFFNALAANLVPVTLLQPLIDGIVNGTPEDGGR